MGEWVENDILKVLITEEEIRERVQQVGQRISMDYEGKKLFCLGVLKGCFIFMADLLRQVDLPCTMDFMAVSSYGVGTTSTGAVRITKDLSFDIEGRDVLIVEDILDSGATLHYLTQYLQNRRPASIRIATLLDKPSRRKAPVTPDYACFTVPDEFVVGYGLDYAERYRNLPFIALLKPEVYS